MKRSQEKYNGKNCQSHNKLKQAWNDTRHPHSRQSKVARNSKLRNACCVQMIKEKFLNAQINKEREKRTKKSTHTESQTNQTTLHSIIVCVCCFFSVSLGISCVSPYTWIYRCGPSSAASLLISLFRAFCSSVQFMGYTQISIKTHQSLKVLLDVWPYTTTNRKLFPNEQW